MVMQGDERLSIQDSGERSVYETGAQRDNAAGKGMPELFSVQGFFRLARWYEMGAKKYSDRNWEKGMPISRYVGAILRHAFRYLAGGNDEDHLAAIAWNAFSIMHHEAERPEQQDLPNWQGRKSKWIYPLNVE